MAVWEVKSGDLLQYVLADSFDIAVRLAFENAPIGCLVGLFVVAQKVGEKDDEEMVGMSEWYITIIGINDHERPPKSRGRPRIPQWKRDEIVRLLALPQMSCRVIAERMNVNRNTVDRIKQEVAKQQCR